MATDPSLLNEYDPTLPETFDSVHATFADLRARCPVAHSTQFDGFWSLQLTDPYTLWSYLLAKQTVGTRAYSTSDLNSTTTTYGSFGQFEPQPAPNGTETVFDLPNNIGYLANTTQVYVNGILQTKDTHYTESDPDAGEITFLGAPQADDQLWIICRTTGT